jgi:hypothetical protein
MGQMGYSQPLQNLYECIAQRKLGFIVNVLNIENNKEIQVALFMVVGIFKIISKHISFGKL